MSSNNYIRKIDELGRIVIPKEVRNKLKITENENIMISCENNKINISKFSHLDNYRNFIIELSNLLNELYQLESTIYDRDKIVYSTSSGKFSNHEETTIIKDSTVIGRIVFFHDNKTDITKLLKFTSRLISIFLSNK